MLVAYCRLCCHCHNLAEGGCFLSRFHFTRCRYFLGHVACRNLPWQGLLLGHFFGPAKWPYIFLSKNPWSLIQSPINTANSHISEPLPGGGACSQDPLTFLDFIPCSPLLKPLVPKNDPNNLVKSSPVPWK